MILEGGLWRFSAGACSGYVLLVSLMIRFLIHGWEERNSNGMKLRVEFE